MHLEVYEKLSTAIQVDAYFWWENEINVFRILSRISITFKLRRFLTNSLLNLVHLPVPSLSMPSRKDWSLEKGWSTQKLPANQGKRRGRSLGRKMSQWPLQQSRRLWTRKCKNPQFIPELSDNLDSAQTDSISHTI